MTIEPHVGAHIEAVFDVYRRIGRECADAIFIEVVGREFSPTFVAELEAFTRTEFEKGVAEQMPAVRLEDTAEVRHILVDIAQAAFVDRFSALCRTTGGAA